MPGRARAPRFRSEETTDDGPTTIDPTDCHVIVPRSANKLRPFMGKWVAILDGEVFFSAETPLEVLRHLKAEGVKADAMFRVPSDPEKSGSSPDE